MRWLFVLGPLVAARAALACPPAAAVDGDAELARAITGVLAQRGVAAATPRCPAAVAHVERRGARIAVRVVAADRDIERDVASTDTAATVIESFARRDLAAPLLQPSVAAKPAPAPVPPPGPAARPASSRGVQLFAMAESARGADTSWVGAHVGACITLGPVCAAVRIRAAGHIDDATVRHSHEMLLGVDWPLALGTATLAPGLAFGMGEIRTSATGVAGARETGGLRADMHATLSIPIGRRTAFDLAISGNLIEGIHVEGASQQLPDEPRGLLRLGAGIRYGGL